MLSLDHMKTYQAFDGDVDGWARSGCPGEMKDVDWALIDELVQALYLIESGLTSTAFAERTELRLAEVTESVQVRSMLRGLGHAMFSHSSNAPQAGGERNSTQ